MDATDSLQVNRAMSTLRQQVTTTLRQAILAGRFAPGARLIERELCESLGVSRPLVREALQLLQGEGLILHTPHKGPTVATISPSEARDIYAVREVLEALAGEGFARHATDAQIATLRRDLDFLATPAASATTDALLAAKNAFYATLLEGCGNAVVGQMLTQLNNRITLLRRVSLGRPGRLPQTLKELDAIVSAIEVRDATTARALCAAHVARAAAAAQEAEAAEP
jgi:GntR family transcriptional regulator, trigonelline degradation regulator